MLTFLALNICNNKKIQKTNLQIFSFIQQLVKVKIKKYSKILTIIHQYKTAKFRTLISNFRITVSKMQVGN